jgi:hypothetical protein
LAAYTFPLTCEDVENTFVESMINANPVMAVSAMGLTPMFPVMAEVPVVEIPLFARITKLPADPIFTAERGKPAFAVGALNEATRENTIVAVRIILRIFFTIIFRLLS